MTLAFPDPVSLCAVLSLATQAPSLRNTQPWRWRVGPDQLTLFADPSRLGNDADQDRRDLLISGGATLHHCTVALAGAGWRSRVERLPDPSDPQQLATIALTPQAPDELDVLLAGAIGRRRTDRLSYESRLSDESWPVPWGNIAVMGARAARAGVMLRQIEPLPPLDEIIAAAACEHAGDDNGVVVALGTRLDDDLAWLRAGEATSLVMLSATAMGLVTCSVTEPLAIPENREVVRADVFGGSGYPQVLMRFGWAPANAEPLPAMPHGPLPEVADWLSAG